ncbi:MAG: hypothetical protein IB618_03440 [Candidatus Pacearchaeota archaeon]|nr:MAG: hypothetical protein IB618_03440 [Candidatus Pacearchaeota archaeon]
MKIKNKKAQAGHAVTWLHKFLILVIVVGGVVAVVTAHYSKQYDMRDIEASTVARNIMECVAPNGIVDEFSEDAIRDCMYFNEQEIYINITLKNDNIALGDEFLFALCQAEKEKVKVKYYPSCLQEEYYVLKNNEDTKIDLFLAIKKVEKNL